MPPFRIPPQPGQESAWDYPRPPRVETARKHIQIIFNGVLIADTRNAQRVLETSHPPSYYIPPEDVRMQYLQHGDAFSLCEWKGAASYYSLVIGEKSIENVAWVYANPMPAFGAIRNHIAFYPHDMDACWVDGERAQPQPGRFYGGWITRDIVGPFKGEPETMDW